MVEGHRHLFAHTEILIKALGGGTVRTYIPDGEQIPPEAIVIRFYREGASVPNGSVQGEHLHGAVTQFGTPKSVSGRTVGSSIPVSNVSTTKKETPN